MALRRRYKLLIHPELMEFIQQRAQRNFRDVNGELNAILAELRDTEAPSAPELPVTPLFPKGHGANDRGPLNTVSGYRGVYMYGKRWQARTTEEGVRVVIATCRTPMEAAKAYDAYMRTHREHPRLNFPQPGERGIGSTYVGSDEAEGSDAVVEPVADPQTLDAEGYALSQTDPFAIPVFDADENQ